jgi:PAS domain S-box-containing protein
MIGPTHGSAEGSGRVAPAAGEQQHDETEQRFRVMADAVPQIVWVTDADGRVEFFNKQWSDYTGVPYEPTTAAAVAATFVHPDDGAATVTAFDEARRTGATFVVEHRIRSAAGDYRWFLVRAEPYRDPATGEIVRWFGASVDIHDRKLAEAERTRLLAELGAERERLRDVILRAPVPMALHDGPEHRYVLVNDAYKRVSGGRDVTGLTLREAFPEIAGQGLYELFDRVYATGEPWDGPETLVRYDRRGTGPEDAWFHLRYDPVRDGRGNVTGIVNFSVDVTHQVRARREVERLLAESERARAEAEGRGASPRPSGPGPWASSRRWPTRISRSTPTSGSWR